MVLGDFYHFGLKERIGPVSSLMPDGAPTFHKGANKVFDNIIPPDISKEFDEFIFFNTIGSIYGVTISCGLDHI